MKEQDSAIIRKGNKKIRVTQTRIDVLNCLKDSHAHTVQDIVNHLTQNNKKVNVASIYNTIKFLIDEGIVDIYTDYENKTHVYEIVDKNDFHLHIYDTTNQKNIKVPMPNDLENEIRNLVKKYNCECHNIKIEILAYNKNINDK